MSHRAGEEGCGAQQTSRSLRRWPGAAQAMGPRSSSAPPPSTCVAQPRIFPFRHAVSALPQDRGQSWQGWRANLCRHEECRSWAKHGAFAAARQQQFSLRRRGCGRPDVWVARAAPCPARFSGARISRSGWSCCPACPDAGTRACDTRRSRRIPAHEIGSSFSSGSAKSMRGIPSPSLLSGPFTLRSGGRPALRVAAAGGTTRRAGSCVNRAPGIGVSEWRG